MNVLVTGGAGFIGSHLTERLLSEGDQVTVVDDLSSGARANLPADPRLRLLELNLLQLRPDQVSSAPDAIIHLAAKPSVADSWARPLAAHEDTLSTVLKVIELRRVWHSARVIWASSAAVYGNPGSVPIAEAALTAPISPYGLQKLTGEHYFEMFAPADGFTAWSLRLFNVFGPRQPPASPYSGVISRFASALRNDGELAVFGDGMQTRDFVPVADVVSAFVLALRAPTGASAHQRLNIGRGIAWPIIQIAQLMIEAAPAWRGKLRFAPVRAGDIRHSQADIAHARAVLGFAPQADFSDSLRRMVVPTLDPNSLA